jgi:tetratricopeptide (TPR) repeat protein
VQLVKEADRFLSVKLSEKAPPLRNTDRGMAALEEAIKRNHPRPLEVYWRLAKACFLMTEGVKNNDQRLIYARKGVTYAQRALKLNAKRVEPPYFLALNTAKVAEATHEVKLMKSIVGYAKRAAAIDESYDDAGPLRILGKVYITAPAWPVSVGSPEKGVEVLSRAVEISPVPINRIFLGQAYYHDEEYERAEKELKQALEDGRITRINARWHKEAEEYLERIDTGSITDPRTNL